MSEGRDGLFDDDQGATAPPLDATPSSSPHAFDPRISAHQPAAAIPAIADEEPPFDPPDTEELGQPYLIADDPSLSGGALAAEVGELVLGASYRTSEGFAAPAPANDCGADQGAAPAPCISIHVSWDRPGIGTTLNTLMADRRMAKAHITEERGGIDGAVARFDGERSPDVLILDTTLASADMLRALDRLAEVLAPSTKILVIGAVNDVALLRELAARGVSEYLIAPASARDLASTVCKHFAESDNSRLIAVIGARGGIGVSTIAHNIAWSVAERQQVGVTLVDLDLAFGVSEFNFSRREIALGEFLQSPARLDDARLERALTPASKRLQVFTANAALAGDDALDGAALENALGRIRRISPVIVLDLPHAWTAWIRRALCLADEIVMVAGPDLASLSSAKAMIEQLKHERAGKAEPTIVLSMVGVPKRPEISARELSEALGATPAMSIRFEPALFGMAALNGRAIGEMLPTSPVAASLDELATALTGRPLVELTQLAAPAEQGAARPAPTLSRHPYIARARKAAIAELRATAPPRARLRAPFALAVCIGATLGLGAWRFQYQPPAPSDAHATSITAQAPATIASPADPAAQYDEATALLRAGRLQEGFDALTIAAEAGSPRAQYRLAKYYERGEGRRSDPVLARQWTERAAEGGNVAAMHDYGVYLAQGEGAPRNDTAAFRWFKQAAEFGFGASQYNVALFYQHGRGIEPNLEEALFWFMLSARNGDAQAQAQADALAASLPIMSAERANARALAFQPRLSDPLANDTSPGSSGVT